MSIKTAIFSFLLCKLIGLIVCSHRHVIIFDAGSTGTRLHLFEFDENFGQFNLTCGIYEETKPGLSAYAKDPEAIRQPLENLLSKAKDAIPESKWFKTPLSLGATAGLRLLPKNEAARILEVCRDVFLNSGFSVSDKSVSMLDESDEGIYCWITANYLLEKFSDESSAAWKKNAVFDLGGGSTQVTMAVSDDFVKNAAPDVQQNIHNLTIANRHLRIYTKSILGLGIMAARRQILCYPEKCLVRKKTVEVKSDCMMTNHSTALEWNYMGQTFKITGTEGPKKMLKCLAIVKQVVLQAMPENLPNFAIRRIIGTSYYVDRAVAVSKQIFTGTAK